MAKQSLTAAIKAVRDACENSENANNVHGWDNVVNGGHFIATGHAMGRRLVIDVPNRRYKVLRRHGNAWRNAIDWQQDPKFHADKAGLKALIKDALTMVHQVRPRR